VPKGCHLPAIDYHGDSRIKNLGISGTCRGIGGIEILESKGRSRNLELTQPELDLELGSETGVEASRIGGGTVAIGGSEAGEAESDTT
jgi:hypothetical protein